MPESRPTGGFVFGMPGIAANRHPSPGIFGKRARGLLTVGFDACLAGESLFQGSAWPGGDFGNTAIFFEIPGEESLFSFLSLRREI